MNIRAEPTPSARLVVPVSFGRPRELAQASIAPISDAVAAVLFDEGPGAAPSGRRPRLSARLDGGTLSGPLLSTCLELRGGGRRHVLLLGRSAGALADRRITLALGARPAASVEPHWLQPPMTDAAALIDGLTDQGRRRLLKLFLTTGASLFGAGEASEFGRAALRLLGLLGVAPVDLVSWCPLGATGGILSYRIAGDLDAVEIGEVVALTGDRIARIAGPAFALERPAGRPVLHVHVPCRVPTGAALIGLGEAPVHLRGPDPSTTPQPLIPWLERRDEATRRWVHGLVEAASVSDPAARLLVRELEHGAEPPQLDIRHLSATPRGVLFALDLADPHGLVRAVRIERGAVAEEVELRPAGRGPGGCRSMVRFLALPRRSRFEDDCRVRLVYQSGRLQGVREARLEVFSGAIPPGLAGFCRGQAAQSIAAARLSMERRVPPLAVETIGIACASPRLSIVTGIGSNLDLIRARAAMLFREPGAHAVELVCHLTAGSLAAAARRAAADAEAVFGISHRLVTLPAESDGCERLLTALAAARAETVLVLGADVLPAEPGWLGAWLRRPTRPITCGPALAFDGSVLAAGGDIVPAEAGRPGRIGRRHLGLPAGDLPGARAAETMLVTADCVGLTRAAVDRLLVSATCYPEPDVLLTEAAEHLRRQGRGARIDYSRRFVRYGEGPPPDAMAEAADVAALSLLLTDFFSGDGGDLRP